MDPAAQPHYVYAVPNPEPPDNRIENPSRAAKVGLTAALVVGAGAVGILVGGLLSRDSDDEIKIGQRGYLIRVVRSSPTTWAWNVTRRTGREVREFDGGQTESVGAALSAAGAALDNAIAQNWR